MEGKTYSIVLKPEIFELLSCKILLNLSLEAEKRQTERFQPFKGDKPLLLGVCV